jgi:translation initiation factor 2 alpha subunit (eIF-2alpha)
MKRWYKLGKPYVQRLKKHRSRIETYHLSTTITSEGPDGVESIAKTLSVGENEEV